jgi:hypothetical protein
MQVVIAYSIGCPIPRSVARERAAINSASRRLVEPAEELDMLHHPYNSWFRPTRNDYNLFIHLMKIQIVVGGFGLPDASKP